MSYLLDKKIKRKKFLSVIFFIILLSSLIYFRVSIFNGLSYIGQIIFHPVLILGNNIGEKLKNTSSYFISKNSLYTQNQSLQSQLNENKSQMSNYNSLLAENENLKEILGRKNEKVAMTLAAILSKPSQSIYGTIVIDAGIKQGIKMGNTVFALGNIPIGRVAEVYPSSSKIILFSNPGETTEVVIGKNVFMQAVGRGGGNFEMNLVKDLVLEKGAEVVLPGIAPYVLGIVETIISDPRDSFQKALLVSPVNIQELKFVEVEK